MKQVIIFEVLRKLKTKPHLMRKLKIFMIIAIVGFLFTGTLIVWAGVATFNYVTSKTNEIIQSPSTINQIENLKLEAKTLPTFKPLNCWEKAQSLIAIDPWVTRPALGNFKNLKIACLEETPTAYQGQDCTQTNTNIRGTI